MEQGGRTEEQLKNHFLVEKELAARLRASTREERSALFGKLYGELFQRVPDHPRLTRRITPEESKRSVEARLRLLRPCLAPGTVFLEIAPGDCKLAYAAAETVKEVLAVDISDQRSPNDPPPPNFKLIVYDGYHLDEVADQSVDLVFSYQFLEHLHPDDIEPHFQLVRRILKPGGRYIFDTPHRFSGPHDISRFFTDDLVCFHFQEYTYRGISALLQRMGFSKPFVFRGGTLRQSTAATNAILLIESLVSCLPGKLRRRICARLFPSVSVMTTREAGNI